MRILHIISTGSLAGTERYLLDLLNHAGCETEVGLVCPNSGPLREVVREMGIPTLELNFGVRSLPRTAFAIFRYIKKWKPALVHTHLGKATLVGAVAARLAGVRAITTLHFIRPAYVATHSKIFYPFFLLAHKLVNLSLTRMIAISKAVGDETVRREKVAPARLVYIPHGTAFQPRLLTPEERCEARKALGLDPSHPVLITIARLENEKGYDLLMEALPRIRQAYPDAQFLWVGDGALREKLEAQLLEIGASERVHLLGFRKDIAYLLALSDLCLHPTPVEGFGMVLLEAMVAGLPIAAINAGGPSEIVVNNQTGLLVPPNPVALAEAVCTLLADPAMAQAMGEAGRQRCATHYTITRMVEQTEQLYRDIVAPKQLTFENSSTN